ncbi:ecdysone receptor-like [Frankliniella occidentalis]|uniref:Ecdysone receptor-like n=1 Tax=Frankliniella occidentalis TaxID=133901 RepID=A0A9C6U6Z5_FRAOC|nr:ecdysone receptor-like [Frankliniella occidentalis]
MDMYCGPAEDKMLGGVHAVVGGLGAAATVVGGSVLNGIKTEQGASMNGNGKRPSPDHWDSSPSHSDSATAAPPLTPSPGPNPHHYTVISNGYSSPMSSGSYDPYSPNGKLGKWSCRSGCFSPRKAKIPPLLMSFRVCLRIIPSYYTICSSSLRLSTPYYSTHLSCLQFFYPCIAIRRRRRVFGCRKGKV